MSLVYVVLSSWLHIKTRYLTDSLHSLLQIFAWGQRFQVPLLGGKNIVMFLFMNFITSLSRQGHRVRVS